MGLAGQFRPGVARRLIRMAIAKSSAPCKGSQTSSSGTQFITAEPTDTSGAHLQLATLPAVERI